MELLILIIVAIIVYARESLVKVQRKVLKAKECFT